MDRRNFIKSICAAPVIAAAWNFIPESNLPRHSLTRPSVMGIPGIEYFDYYPAKGHAIPWGIGRKEHCYLDGKDVHAMCFACDMKAGWVGVWANKYLGVPVTSPLTKLYLFGKVEAR